jgi:hypothetical protein
MGVSVPDLALEKLPPAKLMQVNSPELLNSPDNPAYLEGALAGGFVLPGREGPVFLPQYHYGIFGWGREYAEFEPLPDGSDEYITSHPEMPKDAFWRFDPTLGKKVCRRGEGSKGNFIREVRVCYERVEETGQCCRYNYSKTALHIGRDHTNSSQRLTLEGEEGIKGTVLGRWLKTSRLKSEGTRRWFLPVPTFVGKLGQPNGPSLDTVLMFAELRTAFRQSLSVSLASGPPDPPALDGPPEAPPIDSPPDGPDGDEPDYEF